MRHAEMTALCLAVFLATISALMSASTKTRLWLSDYMVQIALMSADDPSNPILIIDQMGGDRR